MSLSFKAEKKGKKARKKKIIYSGNKKQRTVTLELTM